MINSFKNPAIMRILRTTERYEAGWREQNFISNHEAARLILNTKPGCFAHSGFRHIALEMEDGP